MADWGGKMSPPMTRRKKNRQKIARGFIEIVFVDEWVVRGILALPQSLSCPVDR